MARRFAVESVFTAIDRISRPIDRMSRRVDRFARKSQKVMRSVGGAVAGVARTARNAAVGVAAGVAVVGAGVQRIVDKGADFEQTLVSAGAKFKDPIKKGTEEFRKLEEVASRVGGETEFTATQAAGALRFMAKAGEDAEVAMATLRGQVDFATAAELDLDRATDIVSDSLGALGLSADTTEGKIAGYNRAADLMATTANMANLSAEDLFETIKSGGGTFKGAGQEVETFLAATGVLAGEGIKGSKAGKDMARVFARLGSSGGEAAKKMRQLGLSIKDPKTGKIKELPQILKEIKAKTDKMNEGKALATMFSLFGKNSKESGRILLENIPKLEEYMERVQGATGESERLATTMRDTTAGGIKTMASAFEAIELAVFKQIQPEVDKIIKAVTEWMQLHKQDVAKAVEDGLKRAKRAFVEMKPVVMDLIEAGKFLIDNWAETKLWLSRIIKLYVAYKAVMAATTIASIALKVANFALADSGLGVARASRAAADSLRGGQGLRGALNAAASSGTGMIGKINGVNSVLGKGGLVASAAAAGYALGTMIDEVTGASGHINDLLTAVTSLNDEMDEMERRQNRAAVKSLDERIERVRSDAEADLKAAKDTGFFGTLMGVGTERALRAQRGFEEVRRLEAERVERKQAELDDTLRGNVRLSEQVEGGMSIQPDQSVMLGPQVVSGTDAMVSEVREIREDRQEVTINIKDPGNVAEVEQPALQDTVKVKKSGGL